jgi:hypothetical protein
MRLNNKYKIYLGAGLMVAAMLSASTTAAQTADASETATGPYNMPIQSWQGLGCLYGGVVASAGVFYYQDVLAYALSGAVNPLLLVPLIATGFSVGCSVGYNSAPGLVWLYRLH